MSGGHHHHHPPGSEGRLLLAIAANMAITFVEVGGGLWSGSLGLLSDALHNFGDVGALLVALIAARIGRRPADARCTFGYRRAETVGALINLIILLVSGLYLLCETAMRAFSPREVEGEIVLWVATVALVGNLATVLLMRGPAQGSLNMRAAFLHNLSDALASLGVIIAALVILRFGWVGADTAISLIIALYIVYQGTSLLPQTLHILMEGAPPGIPIEELAALMAQVQGVADVHHVHLWQLDDHQNALEAHVVLHDMNAMETVRAGMKLLLGARFDIHHSTLEFETAQTPDMHHRCHLVGAGAG